MELVRSECIRADALTLVSHKWFGKPNGCEKPIFAVCGGAIESLSDKRVARIHEETGIMALSARCISHESGARR